MPPAIGLAGLLETPAFDVKQPAVIAAANALLFDSPIEERGAPMHATRIHQAGAAFRVPKQDQVFAQDAHLLR